jgi:SAM-dependent methyltransferase
VSVSSDEQGRPTPARIRVTGRALNATVARAPWLWPVLKVPMRRFFDRAAHGWDDRTGAGSSDHLAALAAGLLHVSPVPERALDLGTGTGAGALLVAREFPQARVRGVDVSEAMIARAKSKVGLDPEGRIAFRVADAAALPWPGASFDLVVQLNMPVFFAEVARVLRPGGFVVVAASWGPETPFFTPDAVVARGFAKRGVTQHVAGGAGPGTYWVGRQGSLERR